MTRAPLAVGAMLFAVAAAAQQSPPANDGYAFEHPRVLAQQRIFGLSHAITLLAAACRRDGEAAADKAYGAWRARQGAAIAAAAADLSAWYFGRGIADWQSIAQRIGLRETLAQAPGSPELRAACATLPEALEQPRYDLAARFRLEEQMARTVAAVEVDARHRRCLEQLTGPELETLEARHREWREINDPLARAAAGVLQREWPEDAPAPSFEQWVAALKKGSRAGSDRAACLRFSASLKQPEGALSDVFRMPPPRNPK